MTFTGRVGTLRNSLAFRLVARFVLVASFVALLVSALYVVTTIRKDRLNAEKTARLAAVGLAESARLPLFSGNRESLSELAGYAIDNPEIRRATIFDGTGRVLADAARPGGSKTQALTVAVRRNSPAPSPASVLVGQGDPRELPLGTVRLEYATVLFSEQILETVGVGGAFALIYLILVSMLGY
ncbi:MAG TPA: hypothetical protein VIU29_01440, partial [Candidatus Deferrimicrobiaceae bacterium]